MSSKYEEVIREKNSYFYIHKKTISFDGISKYKNLLIPMIFDKFRNNCKFLKTKISEQSNLVGNKGLFCKANSHSCRDKDIFIGNNVENILSESEKPMESLKNRKNENDFSNFLYKRHLFKRKIINELIHIKGNQITPKSNCSPRKMIREEKCIENNSENQIPHYVKIYDKNHLNKNLFLNKKVDICKILSQQKSSIFNSKKTINETSIKKHLIIDIPSINQFISDELFKQKKEEIPTINGIRSLDKFKSKLFSQNPARHYICMPKIEIGRTNRN